MILKYCLIVFLTNFLFLAFRTWNVQAIAKDDLIQTIISGAFVHISWLISIAIGTVSMIEIIDNFQWQYLPVIGSSLLGGTLGTILVMHGPIHNKLKTFWKNIIK